MKRISVLLLILVMILLSSCSIQAKVPYIGENGNWWVGDEDLGVAAQVSVEDANSQTDNSETQENDSFIPGENLYCAYEVPFSMPINDPVAALGVPSSYEGEMATITSLVVTKEKEHDINNVDDYVGNGFYSFYKYSYMVAVTGTVKDEYAGQRIVFRLHSFAAPDGEAIVNSDGSFVINWRAYSNSNENEIVPDNIQLV